MMISPDIPPEFAAALRAELATATARANRAAKGAGRSRHWRTLLTFHLREINAIRRLLRGDTFTLPRSEQNGPQR